MHLNRAISALVIFVATLLYSSNLLGIINLNDVMSPADQQKTGVANLTDAQKKELEAWINNKFVLKTTINPPASQPLYLQQNIQGGTQLMLSDGSIYEIAPTDRAKAVFWITPIGIAIDQSGDPNYPARITNTLTGVSVNGKLVKPPKSAAAPQ